jgi:AcrR family transcriptional regulator
VRSQATRAKLLEAAREEFQKNGFAGGRVDAIADLAGVNKRLIYAYFTSKSGLFETVLADNTARVAAAVNFTPDDLAGYAAQLFDFWMDDTTSLRLFSWRNVETGSVPEFENTTYEHMIKEIAQSPIGQETGLPPAHVLAFIFALVLAWAIPAQAFQGLNDAELQERRTSIRTAVTRMLRP